MFNRMRKTLSIILAVSLVLLCGCKDTTSTTTPASTTTTISASTSVSASTETSSETSSETSTETSSETSSEASTETSASADVVTAIPVKFTIVNMCGVDIGLITSIDPNTKEETQWGALPDQNLMTVTIDWPLDTTIFEMVIYNQLYEKVCTSQVDITGATKSVTLLLTYSDDEVHVTRSDMQ